MQRKPARSDTRPDADAECAATGANDNADAAALKPARPVEIGGRDGPDPTRYGDWEKAGRCIDF